MILACSPPSSRCSPLGTSVASICGLRLVVWGVGGAGAGGLFMQCGRRPAIGGRPRGRPPRRLASPSRSYSQTVAGCRLGGYPAGRDRWGGERVVGGVLPRISIDDLWGESSIMTGVYERWCSSTLHIGWGLCDCLCLVLVCRGSYSLGGVVLLALLFILGSSLGGVGLVRGLRGGRWNEGGGVRSGPGSARTILLFHTSSARPPKQPRMVRTFLKVHTRPRLSYTLWCRGY
jgi:hypothetical protein